MDTRAHRSLCTEAVTVKTRDRHASPSTCKVLDSMKPAVRRGSQIRVHLKRGFTIVWGLQRLYLRDVWMSQDQMFHLTCSLERLYN
eukprot:1136712-Pelagomonas_calceolata.AAC.3